MNTPYADDNMDWDYYEYGQQEMEQQHIMQGIAKFNKRVVYRSKNFQDTQFSHFQIAPKMEDLNGSHGIFAKDSLITKPAGNLKQIEKVNEEIKIDYTSAKIPKRGQNELINQEQDLRFQSGSVVSLFPSTAIGLVTATFKNGTIQRGTGSVCGPNHVITASHIFFSQDKSELVSVQFFPGAVSTHCVYKAPEILKVIVLDEKNEFPLQDMGILILDYPLGLYTGWFGLAALCDEVMKVLKIDITGYPQAKEENKHLYQYTQSGQFAQINDQQLLYNIEATGGQNGSPIYAERVISETQSEMYIVGIHIARSKDNKNNMGLRISKKKLDLLRELMEFHFLPESLQETFFSRLISSQEYFMADFDECNTTEKNASDICYSLRHNLGLKDVHIRIKNKETKPVTTDDAIKELSESLRQIRKIKHLKLDLFNSENLTDESLKYLGHGLESLKDLEFLSITISGNSKFTNNGIKDLTAHLQNLHLLNNLTLFLYSIKSLNDDAGKIIGTNVSLIPNLKNLKIDFQMMKNIGEKGVKGMTNSIQQCKKLESLNFVFMGLNLQDKFKQDVKKQFTRLKSFSFV